MATAGERGRARREVTAGDVSKGHNAGHYTELIDHI